MSGHCNIGRSGSQSRVESRETNKNNSCYFVEIRGVFAVRHSRFGPSQSILKAWAPRPRAWGWAPSPLARLAEPAAAAAVERSAAPRSRCVQSRGRHGPWLWRLRPERHTRCVCARATALPAAMAAYWRRGFRQGGLPNAFGDGPMDAPAGGGGAGSQRRRAQESPAERCCQRRR